MKKFFTLIAAAVLSVSAFAASDPISLPTSWGGGCKVNGSTYTFTGSWQGAGSYLGQFDASAYDYACIKYSACSGGVNFNVNYNQVTKHQSWGNEYASGSVALDKTSETTYAFVKLDKTSKFTETVKDEKGNITSGVNEIDADGDDTTAPTAAATVGDTYDKSIFQLVVQNGNTDASLTIEEITFITAAEYETLKAEADKVDKQVDFDAKGGTHTLAAKNWGWDQNWLDKDVTNYNTLVFEVASVTGHGKITIKGTNAAGEEVNLEVDLPASTTPITYAVDISGMTHLNAYAYQNLNKPDKRADGSDTDVTDVEETTIVVTKVYATSKKNTEVNSVKTITAKKAVDEDAPTYNLSGQRVSKSYRGIVIKGGKKYIVK